MECLIFKIITVDYKIKNFDIDFEVKFQRVAVMVNGNLFSYIFLRTELRFVDVEKNGAKSDKFGKNIRHFFTCYIAYLELN